MDAKKVSPWYEDAIATVQRLGSDLKSGLSEEEAASRLKQYGPNEIPEPPSPSLLSLIIGQFKDLLVLILLGAAVVSFALALFEHSEDRLTAFVEPAVILIILAANATVGVIQERNAEKAISALKESEARDAQVLRNGIVRTVHSSNVVPGDIIMVAVGDKVPADARIAELQSTALTVDESMLTGESVAAQKHMTQITVPNAVNQDKRNMLFSGTLVVRGKAKAIVTSTGSLTEMGAIAKDLDENEPDKTPLQQKLDRFGTQLSKYIGVICVVVWIINIGHFTDPDHGSVLRGAIYYFKIAVALAVAAIPEGLPAVVTTCLALGTRKMAKKNAIVRSLPSVETLGCTTVICSDKTGTLTTNQMCVQKVMTVSSIEDQTVFKHFEVAGDSFSPIGAIKVEGKNQLKVPALDEPTLAEVGKICALCNESTLGFSKKRDEDKAGAYTKTGAPTEAALLVLAEKIGVPDRKGHEAAQALPDGNDRATVARRHWDHQYKKLAVLEFDRNRKSMSVLAEDNNGKQFLFVKGAPEKLLARCDHVRTNTGTAPFDEKARGAVEAQLNQFASQGLRCLAIAYRPWPAGVTPDFSKEEDFPKYESKLVFVGLACMLDPPRAAVRGSIARCRNAGIRVIVITGDNKVTAEAICRRIGIFGETEALEGKSFEGHELETMDVSQKVTAINGASLFSRVEPKHKLEIVNLLKSQHEIVAMTGDGVNDATALKKADIGIAMGSGTDVAREASDMVLQDDNFATIVMAVEEGRAIYANTKQFIRYLISSNIGEVACIFLTAAIGMPEALIPVQLLWVNLVTDGLPATALGFNPPDKDIMERDPRGKDEEIINGWLFFRYLVIGIYVGIATVGGFIWWSTVFAGGPHLTWNQLTNFHACATKTRPDLFEGLDCNIFHDPRPSTVALSILVTIEMFNALNAISENQSLLVVPPNSNPWVVLACLLSLSLHFIILYIPFFANVFHVAPLNLQEWLGVLLLSMPVLFIDETLKLVSRKREGRGGSFRKIPAKKAHVD
jgi:Ca2+ transporting ATPase